METLLTMLFSDRFGALMQEAQQVQRSPEADALRTRIRKGIQNKSVQPEEKKKSSCKTSPKRIQFPRYPKGTGTFL
jgi:hypothetical protein